MAGESNVVTLHKWLLATYLLSCSKKGMSSLQLQRMLGVTYKTAWFMTHRIRDAMRVDGPAPVGGEGKTVEMDETYVGGLERNKHASKRVGHNAKGGKQAVLRVLGSLGGVPAYHVVVGEVNPQDPAHVAAMEQHVRDGKIPKLPFARSETAPLPAGGV